MENKDKIKVHYLRQFIASHLTSDKIIMHNSLPGCHGLNPKYCKACVVAVVAIIESEGETFVGVALRNPIDQFNSKIGRAIAIGRAKKDQSYGGALTGPYLENFYSKIQSSYESPNHDILAKWRAYVR